MKILLACDFDLTITRIHTGGVYCRLTPEQMIHATLTADLARKTLDRDNYFAVCTHGKSREMIYETLQMIGLTDDYLSRISIQTGNASDKNTHIRKAYLESGLIDSNGRALQHFPIRTLLLDDDITNSVRAFQNGALILMPIHQYGLDYEINEFDLSHLQTALEIVENPLRAEILAHRHAQERGYSHELVLQTPFATR